VQDQYAAQQAQYNAELERIRAANTAAQAQYQRDLADNEACRKGKKSRCK
jgi:hypothetical protein